MMEQLFVGLDNAKHNLLLEKMALLKLGMAGPKFSLGKDTDRRMTFLQGLLHVCDIGYPTKNFHLYEVWSDRVVAEYFRQGDIEAEKGLAISPMCDSARNNIVDCKIGFIDFIVTPTWTIFAEMVGSDVGEMMNNLKLNRSQLEKLSRTTDVAAGESKGDFSNSFFCGSIT